MEDQKYDYSEFIPLDDLVYAPLHALALSNEQLRARVVDAIKNMGTVKQNGSEEIVKLNNINIAYEQVRPESGEGYNVDNLQMQVPLLSIIPITNLNVDKAEIDFDAEIKAEKGEQGQYIINGRICSPEQRESDFLPRVSYRMRISSLPATEGVMRLTDTFSSNQVTKKLDTTPVAVDGNLGSDDQKELWQETTMLKNKINRLRRLYRRISDMIADQEQMEQVGKSAFADTIREFDKDKYLMAQANIANRIMEYQEQIMNREIEYGLDKDYE